MSDEIREGDLVLTPGEFGRVVGDASGSVVVVDHDGHCTVYPRDEVESVVGVSERDAMRDVVRNAMAEGHTMASIARELGVTRQAVQWHAKRIREGA